MSYPVCRLLQAEVNERAISNASSRQLIFQTQIYQDNPEVASLLALAIAAAVARESYEAELTKLLQKFEIPVDTQAG